MEKVWRIVYSPALFCTPNLLKSLVLLTVRGRDVKLQPHGWRAQPWLQTWSDLRILNWTFAPTKLRRSGRTLKLERIPMEVLFLLVERRGQLVTREEIIEKLWGKNVFLDTDNAINTAIRKIRQVLKDDPEQPRFIQTVTGRGYRFIGQISEVVVPPAKCASSGATAFEFESSCSADNHRSNDRSPNGYWKALEADCSRYRGCAGVVSRWLLLSPPHTEAHGQRHDCPCRLQ